MLRSLFTCIGLVCLFHANAQNFYRSQQNPHYWKNRLPRAGYWQQDVQYKIKAAVNEKTMVITGQEELTYWNNSPDTLKFVYFHLYQNAFQPGSYAHSLNENNGNPPKYGGYESRKLGTRVLKMESKGKALLTELDNTILKVYLNEPLLPGQSTTFNMQFKTFFDAGSLRRRMKVFMSSGSLHFDGVHWYPRISVYDEKMGWDTQQHLGKEFYGDYGTYDVELTFANNYIVEATGELINENEVLPKDLRARLDIKNFKDKPWDSKPSIVVEYDSTLTKTWKYHAENVHDFAFTADPNYRIGEVNWQGIRCIAVVQEPHASKWQNAAEYTAEVIKTYSKEIGRYIYPKMVVADARDGMEYPMLTLDGGSDPDYRSLFAHEIGHNWFYGMVGNNETYRAALDEGFTQYIETIAQRKIDGDYDTVAPVKNAYVRNFKRRDLVTDRYFMNNYLNEAIRENDKALNTHSDEFETALGHGGGYRNVYFKTATMLHNLQYVLGDSLFSAALKNYFKQWHCAHPYMEDFRNSFIRFTKVDLNWFFDQWLETTKRIDYSVKSIRKAEEKNTYAITFERKEEMQMPLDFKVVVDDSTAYDFHIPNNWFVKKTDANVLPRWIGWGKVNPTYTFKVVAENGIKDVVIDPSNRLADINMLNNNKKGKTRLHFDSQISNASDWRHYEIYARPDIWYNFYDGLKLGFNVNGNYMNHAHIFSLSAWANSGFLQYRPDTSAGINGFDILSFNFNYKTNLDKLSKNSWISLNLKWLDGMQGYNLGFEKFSKDTKNRFFLNFKGMYRHGSNQLNYLHNPDDWTMNRLNSQVIIGVEHKYQYVKGQGNIQFWVKTIGPGSQYNFSQMAFQVVNKSRLDKFGFNSRFFALLGTGSSTPQESKLYLAGASPEEMMDNKYVRSAAFFPTSWTGMGDNIRHMQYGGGLNLRGYAGYLAPTTDDNGNIILNYASTSGASVNVELEFDKYFGWKPKKLGEYFDLDAYLFADAGVLNANLPKEKFKLGPFRADAGVGIAFTVKKWGFLQKVHPLTIRADFPLWLNRTPAIDPANFQFRWMLGISRAF